VTQQHNEHQKQKLATLRSTNPVLACLVPTISASVPAAMLAAVFIN
jgi:hypothetical protein